MDTSKLPVGEAYATSHSEAVQLLLENTASKQIFLLEMWCDLLYVLPFLHHAEPWRYTNLGLQWYRALCAAPYCQSIFGGKAGSDD